MKIFVTVKPNAKEKGIEEIHAGHFVVRVTETPQNGKANAAVGRVLAEHFGVALARVRLVRGFSSRQKVFEIL